MVIVRQVQKYSAEIVRLRSSVRVPPSFSVMVLALCTALLAVAGCGQTSKPVVSPAAGEVDSYFGGPFNVAGSSLAVSAASFDHSANQIAVSGLITHSGARVPVNIINGSFTTAETGFLGITESFAINANGVLTSLNPSLTGAWATEIPGAGVLANFLSVNDSNTPATISAAPIAMAQNTACPNFPKATQFLYVTVPNTGQITDTADYGSVMISSQGSAVTFSAQPFLVGAQQQPASVVTGGCSQTPLGALTAYPLNSFVSTFSLELISIGNSGLLASSYGNASSGVGAFGGGTGVLGVAAPSSPVNVSAVVAAQYNGFFFSPKNTALQESYDITVLASSYGDYSATSQACSALEASLTANNNGNGNGLVPVLPSPNSIYGGEFLAGTPPVNDPTGASGPENCDVVIDLGTQDSSNNGLFPNATIFIGQTFPPFNTTNPWTCGTACAVSFPAAAVVGQVQGQYVIFVSASALSNPPAQLPNGGGLLTPQPVGIYLFQR
jgi:hypothetical protein